MNRATLAIGMLMLGAGCAHWGGKSNEANLLEIDRQFSACSVSNGAAAAFATYFAEDALSLPAGEEPITGRTAIVKSLESLNAGTLLWTPRQEFISRSDDLGYTWGTYEFHTIGTNGQPRVGYGKYCTVWRKQVDGSWKAVLDIGNQSPPPH
jgi:ketosteroid isomerase-like protein